jgi:D-amino peptidase
MVGMHARAGTPDGVLCHTISTVTWRNLWFNDDLVGELGVNAALCGHYGCPVALVTGDDAVLRESQEILGDDAVYVSVKTGLSRYSARQVPPVKARQRIEDGAREALLRVKKGRVYNPGTPCTITIEVETVEKVGKFRGREGVEVVGPLKVQSHGKNWMEAWDRIWPQADL